MSCVGIILVVVLMGSSPSSSVGGSSVIYVMIAEIMHVVEVGNQTACMDVSWVVGMSRSSLTGL